MSSSLEVTRHLRTRKTIRCTFLAVLFCAWLLSLAVSQQASKGATLSGVVRDQQGKAVAAATVHLQRKDSPATQTVNTDSEGQYMFAGVAEGVYILHAEMAGYNAAEIPSLFIRSSPTTSADLTLQITHPGSESSSPKFFDPPQFTVSGVTDTTSLGGHGSDTIVRTREGLAKDIAALSRTNTGSTNLPEQEKTARERIAREPDTFEANHSLGHILLEEGKAHDAIPYLERAAARKPSDLGNAYDLASATAMIGDYKSARAKAQALLAHEDRAEVHHLLADAEENLGDSLAAVREYQRAAELDPRETYLFDWGSELLLHHAPEPALEVFSQGHRLFPSSVRMLIGLGVSSFARGSYDQAVQRLREASDLNPDDPAPYLFLGRLLSAEASASNALVDRLHRFVVLQPDSPQSNYYYALALWKGRKGAGDSATLSQTASLLNRAIGLDPKFAAAFQLLGALHSEQADLPKAILDYRSAIEADPQTEEAHYRLAQAYRQIGETEKAKAELQAYEQIVKQSAQKAEEQRHEIRQFVYTLRDQRPAPTD